MTTPNQWWTAIPVQLRRFLRITAMVIVAVVGLMAIDVGVFEKFPSASVFIVALLTALQEVVHREIAPATPDREKANG